MAFPLLSFENNSQNVWCMLLEAGVWVVDGLKVPDIYVVTEDVALPRLRHWLH